MFFQSLNAYFTSAQDVIYALIHPSEPQAKPPPPPPRPAPSTWNPLESLWSMIYSPQATSTPPTSTQPKPPQDGAPTEVKPVIETITSNPPSLFALIIGINEYKTPEIANLSGAVGDAKAIKSYLETSLGVPATQIQTLYDSEATRDAIVQALRTLKTDPRIEKGDPILIFYSGHGGTGKTPAGWEAGSSEIQILLSHDAGCEDKGRRICGIPDRTMGVLLEQIAKEKGNNITVIFDCCHSGSLTRSERARLVRGVKIKFEIPSDLDKDILGGHRGAAVQEKYLQSRLSSHVLLAACGEKEYAREGITDDRGEFTLALLNTLASVGADKVTYTDLIQRLPNLVDQNPQCVGHNQGRVLFNSKAPDQRRQLYVVRVDNGICILEAGAAHGITKGATFDVYKDRDCVTGGTPLATLTALEPPGPFSTLLSGDMPAIDTQAVALQTGAGAEEDLLIYLELDPKLEPVFLALAEEIKGNKIGQQQIGIVKEDRISTAHLGIASENDKIVFNILNPLVTKYGFKRIPFQLNPVVDDIRRVLRAAGHFNWHLRRTGESQFLQKHVKFEFTKLKDSDDGDEDDEDEDGNGCAPDGPNLIEEGVIDIVVNDDDIYGMKISNTSSKPLYVSVFYFDNSDLSITSYFQPPASGSKVDPPLLPYQSLTIGYGAGGTQPLSYSLGKERPIDVGFIKVFTSTEQVDLSAVPQASPFPRNNRGVGPPKVKPPRKQWNTTLITVVQRKQSPS
ncbi:hypothetical protein M408DRAFT_331034 [Serendipita vermifera MAFF 305830]|uniref:Peptidase C14 caspase domain-containing protein n=1 Tax=Serendipita vermifera MAFF 305830 TaxID=933852 RepID=A0A0C2X901_SERVB|nr:hypothetical protein M408DRAFT_331034 [Serendipita vermifera MAFF 305830]